MSFSNVEDHKLSFFNLHLKSPEKNQMQNHRRFQSRSQFQSNSIPDKGKKDDHAQPPYIIICMVGDVICSSIEVPMTIDLVGAVVMKLNPQMMDVDAKIQPVVSCVVFVLVSIPDDPKQI